MLVNPLPSILILNTIPQLVLLKLPAKAVPYKMLLNIVKLLRRNNERTHVRCYEIYDLVGDEAHFKFGLPVFQLEPSHVGSYVMEKENRPPSP
jgi:hypothetical protein